MDTYYNAVVLRNSQIDLQTPLTDRDILSYDEDIELFLPASIDSLPSGAIQDSPTGMTGTGGSLGYTGSIGYLNNGYTGPTGPVRLSTDIPDGTIGSPSVAFEDQTDLGFYRKADKTIAFGNDVFVLTDTRATVQQIQMSINSTLEINSSLGIRFSSPGNNRVQIGGVSRLRTALSYNTSNNVYFGGTTGIGFTVNGHQDYTFGVDGNGLVFTLTGENLQTNTDIYPMLDDTYSLGISGRRWSEVWAQDGNIQTSDLSEKTDVQSKLIGLSALNSLSPVKWKWADSPTGASKYGFTSQDVTNVLNAQNESDLDIVNTSGEYEGMNYQSMIPILVSSIQELSAKVQAEKTLRGI